MNEEITAIEKNKTWNLTELPKGKQAIGLKCIFKIKYGVDGSIQHHKERLVEKGYSQLQGIDYEETFSPMACFETVRFILAVAAHNQWIVNHIDDKFTILNAELKEEVYVTQPDGYKKLREEQKLYKLNKAFYGQMQAPRAWYSCIDEFFIQSLCMIDHVNQYS